jgi:cell division transport system permease protein
MSEQQPYKPTKKYQATYKYAILTISLNLFIIGLFASILYLTKNTINKLKQDIDIELVLIDTLDNNQIAKIKQELKKKDYISKINYRSKEKAAEIYERELGQNFTQILGYNPLYNSYIVNIKPAALDAENLKEIKSDFLIIKGIKDVSYSEPVSNFVSTTVKPAFITISILSIILLLIAFSVIDTTIRLKMYSQRYAIRTMQLIGSTNWFIIKPYIQNALKAGAISVLLCIVFLTMLVGFGIYKYNIILNNNDIVFFILLAITLIIISLLISTISTYFAVRKYLNLNLDELV